MDTDTQQRAPCEDGGRDQGRSTSQGISKIPTKSPKAERKQETDFLIPYQTMREQGIQSLHFRPTVSIFPSSSTLQLEGSIF